MGRKKMWDGSDEYCGNTSGTWCLSPLVQVKQLEMETWHIVSQFRVGKLQSKDWVKSEIGSDLSESSGGVEGWCKPLFRTSKSAAPIFQFRVNRSPPTCSDIGMDCTTLLNHVQMQDLARNAVIGFWLLICHKVSGRVP